MSRIAAIFQRDGGPVPADEIARLLAPDELPGASVQTREVAAGVALGATLAPHQRKSAGPCSDPRSGISILFDGRLDNRPELTRRYGIGVELSPALPDVEVVLRCYLAGGEGALQAIVGPFALVLADPGARRISLYRDPLGSRTLHYLADARRLAACTRMSGLLTMAGASAEPNEVSIARFLALSGPVPGATFFSGIHEVPPGFVVEAGPERLAARRFDQLRPAETAGTERDLEQRFLELLAEAVRCRTAGAGRAGVQMSGGFDSTAVAAVMAHALPAGERLTTISYVFRELAAIDESRWIDAMSKRWNLDSVRFDGDSEWPLRGEQADSQHLGAPIRMLYSGLRQRSLEIARERGIETLLTGEFGDDLWTGGTGWLSGLLRDGEVTAAMTGLLRLMQLTARGLRPHYSLRASLAYALRPSRHAGSAPAAKPAPWLTQRGRELVGSQDAAAPAAGDGAIPERAGGLLSTLNLAYTAEADDQAARAGVSIRRPYRDRRLVEFMISVPPRLLYRPGASKLLLRRALRNLLPREIVARRTTTPMTPLFDRGLGDREWPKVQALLQDRLALWPRWVDADRLWRTVPECLRDGSDSRFHVVVWHCVCIELWRRQVAAGVAPSAQSGIDYDIFDRSLRSA